GNPPPAAVRLLLCFVLIAKMLGDRERLGKFIMLWAAHCRNEGRQRAALRRFAQAEKVAESTFLRLGALVGRAGVYDQLNDNVRAVDAYAAALDIAKASPEHAIGIPSTSFKLATCLRGLSRYSDALRLIDAALAGAAALAQIPQMRSNLELRCRLYRGLL